MSIHNSLTHPAITRNNESSCSLGPVPPPPPSMQCLSLFSNPLYIIPPAFSTLFFFTPHPVCPLSRTSLRILSNGQSRRSLRLAHLCYDPYVVPLSGCTSDHANIAWGDLGSIVLLPSSSSSRLDLSIIPSRHLPGICSFFPFSNFFFLVIFLKKSPRAHLIHHIDFILELRGSGALENGNVVLLARPKKTPKREGCVRS